MRALLNNNLLAIHNVQALLQIAINTTTTKIVNGCIGYLVSCNVVDCCNRTIESYTGNAFNVETSVERIYISICSTLMKVAFFINAILALCFGTCVNTYEVSAKIFWCCYNTLISKGKL